MSGARGLLLRGFSKPGFPGVVCCEGDEGACTYFVSSLRALRWQAMDVRYTQQMQEGAQVGQLPAPFIELAESAMGEAAALCEAAGMLDAFRSAVLKLSP